MFPLHVASKLILGMPGGTSSGGGRSSPATSAKTRGTPHGLLRLQSSTVRSAGPDQTGIHRRAHRKAHANVMMASWPSSAQAGFFVQFVGQASFFRSMFRLRMMSAVVVLGFIAISPPKCAMSPGYTRHRFLVVHLQAQVIAQICIPRICGGR